MKYIALGVSLMFILFAIGGMLEIIVKKPQGAERKNIYIAIVVFILSALWYGSAYFIP